MKKSRDSTYLRPHAHRRERDGQINMWQDAPIFYPKNISINVRDQEFVFLSRIKFADNTTYYLCQSVVQNSRKYYECLVSANSVRFRSPGVSMFNSLEGRHEKQKICPAVGPTFQSSCIEDSVALTRWGSKLTTIGPGNGLSPVRQKAIIWTNTGIFVIRTIGTNFS